jgi:hypothetical protein
MSFSHLNNVFHYFLPFRFSTSSTRFNDTLEIDPDGDMIHMHFISEALKMEVKDSIEYRP